MRRNNVFPEIPGHFHARVIETLYPEKNNTAERIRIMNKKRVLAVVAAVLALAVAGTMGAYALISWNAQLAEKFEADPAQQQALLNNRTSSFINQSVIDNGLTVTAVQSLGDKNGMYILFEVAPPDDLAIDYHRDMFETEVAIEGVPNANYFAGFMSPAHYEIWVFNNDQMDLSGRTISVALRNLQGDSDKLDLYTKLPGNWEFAWQIEQQDHTQVFAVNQPVDALDIVIETLEISPLSYTLTIGGGAAAVLAGSASGQSSLSLPTFVLSDGTTFGGESFGGPGIQGPAGETFVSRTSFSKILDVGALTGMNIMIDGQLVSVELK
jgi:hypothetical protein